MASGSKQCYDCFTPRIIQMQQKAMNSEEYAFLEKMHRAVNIVLEIPYRETDWNISNWCSNWNISILVFMFKFRTYCSQSTSSNQEHNSSSTYAYSAFSTITTEMCFSLFGFLFRPPGKWPDDVISFKEDIVISSRGEGGGDTHITGRHFGGDTHITSDMCVGIHISRGYTYH